MAIPVNGNSGLTRVESVEFAGGTGSEVQARRELQRQGMDPGLAGAGGESQGQGFSDLLRNSIEKVNAYQQQADQAVKEMVAGRSKNIHETMLAVERADVSLKLMMQVRNKVLDAYREVMRMQV